MRRINQSRWVPKGSREISHELGVVYVYEYETGPMKVAAFAVCAYTGRANKAAFHESYHRAESRDKRVADFFSGLESHAREKAAWKAETSKPHTLRPGVILHHSWGWEQTQCDYYQVLSVTDHTMIIQAIGDETVEGSTYSHGMADMRLPVRDAFCGKPFRVKVDGRNYVRVGDGPLSHGSCSVWDGKAQYCSWYA
jgi:hypothetical protein